MVLGLALALVSGFAVAVAIHFSPLARRAIYPLAVGSQAVPVAVIATLLVFWWGFGIWPKLVVIALICFFPVVVTTVDGLAAVDPDQLKLLRTLDASRWQAFRIAEMPAALPAALSGTRIALAVGVIGAYIAEVTTAGTSAGLGHEIEMDLSTLQTPRAWAATAVLFVFAVACFYTLALIERRLAPWAHPRKGERTLRASPVRRASPPRAGRRAPAPHRSALVLALALSACGEKKDTVVPSATKTFTVMLDYFPNADHAALYSAIANGDFRAGGLDVKPETPANPAEPLRLLAAGKVDMAISYEPEVLIARDQGLKVVSIAALVQRPLTSIIALPDQHVKKVADLKGKKVGTAGIPYQAAELKTALQNAGVDPSTVQEVNVGFNLVPAMLSGKVAATLGGFWNYEAIQLEAVAQAPDHDPRG